jgi:deoxycytidylate deaminase
MKSSKIKQHMAHAKFIGELYSKDASSKVGALIIGENGKPLSWGYNGFPAGANDDPETHPERHDRTTEKSHWSEHAVYVEEKAFSVERWQESWNLAQEIYAETGVKITAVSDT